MPPPRVAQLRWQRVSALRAAASLVTSAYGPCMAAASCAGLGSRASLGCPFRVGCGRRVFTGWNGGA